MFFGRPQRAHIGAHVTRKRGVYYYRRRLPRPLQGEIGLSLRTAHYREAQHLAQLLDEKLTALLALAVDTIDAMNVTEILREELERETRNRWKSYVHAPAGRSVLFDGWEPADGDSLRFDLAFIDDAITSTEGDIRRRSYAGVGEWAEQLAARHAIPFEQLPELMMGLLHMRLELERAQKAWLLGSPGPATPVKSAAPQPTPASEPERTGPLLSEAQELLFSAMRSKPQPWEPNTIRKAETTFRLFREFAGDRPIGEYKRSDCHAFYRALAQLPRSYGKSPTDRGRTMPELIEAAKGVDVPRLASKSIKGHSSPLGALFEHFRDPDAGAWTNPAYGFDFTRIGAASVPREMWEGEPLRALFNAPVWTGCKSEGRRKERGALIIQDHRYWLPLLALYHGARLEELARLIRGEVREEDGVPFVWITDTDEAAEGAEVVRKGRVKTAAAKRRVPLHQEVLRLGFLDYVKATAPTPGDQLFPLMKPDPKNGNLRSGKFSQWFTDYRRAAGVAKDSLTFHSFRHGVATQLSAAGIPDATIIELIGHEGTTTLQTHYIKRGRIPLPMLLEAVNRVQWPEVNLKRAELLLGRKSDA